MFELVVATVDKVYFEGAAQSVTVPGEEGEVTILAHHEPFVTPLRPGTITVRTLGEEKTIPASSGLLEVHKEGVTILL